MGNDFSTALRPAIVLTILFAILLGIVYPLAMTGVAQTVFPYQANGSLIKERERVIGSTLLGQGFTSDRYFHSRPSAAGKGYDALASAGSNLGPTSQALLDRVKADVARQRRDGVNGSVPVDLVTASGSGLDSDLSPVAALVQVDRVARDRGLAPERVRSLVEGNVERPLLGFIGEDRVNVLALNRQLDALAGGPDPH